MHSITRRGLLVSAAAAGATLAAPAVKAQKTGTLEVLFTDPHIMKEVHETIASRFEQANPGVKIRLTVAANYTDGMQRVLRESLTGNLPDLAFHGHNNVVHLVRRGLVYPLDKFIASDGERLREGRPDALLGVGRSEGHSYAVPFIISIPVVYHNLDLAAAAGLDIAALPRDWAAITERGARLKEHTGGAYFTYDTDGSWTPMALIFSLGGRVLTDDERDIAFDSAEGLEAMRILAAIAKARGGTDMTKPQARQAFSAGTLPILIDSSSGLGNYERAAAGRFRIKTERFPLVAGRGRIPPSGASATLMTKDEAKQRLAWDYILFATNPENQTLMATRTGFAPVNTIAAQRPEFLGKWLEERPNYRTAIDTLTDLTPWPSFPGPNALRIDRQLVEELQKLMTLQVGPEDALKNVVRIVRAGI